MKREAILPDGETALPEERDVESAYVYCRRIAHRYGANFSVGFRFLPREKRRAVYAAYAFCRLADDISDGAGQTIGDRETPLDGVHPGTAAPDRESHLTTAARNRVLASLDEWQKELGDCYAGSPTHPVTIALADSLRRFAIPKDAFLALIDGCRQDMVKTRYANFGELLLYCDLVASSISDISLSIFGYRTPAAICYGRALSTALQLTNVARDVGDDLGRDRIYLPQDELARFGVSGAALQRREETPQMRALMIFQIDRAESYFQKAEPLLGELEFDARFPTLLMGGVYATVLGKLRCNPLVPLRRRVALSLPRKLMVVGTRMLRPHFV